MTDLNKAYRPVQWDEVVGQDSAVRAIKSVLKSKASQALLLFGPSGVGKTTIARIAANEFGCNQSTILSIDAATHTGIEKMREVQDMIRYKPIMGDSGKRAVIVDECHRLSGNAWDSLLTSVEEPPQHMLWVFCTTNVAKVPITIKTRCAKFGLKEVSDKDLDFLVRDVAKGEQHKIPDEVIRVVVSEARGSPREALNNLSMCVDAKNRREAADLLKAVIDENSTIELCRFLANSSGSWVKCMAIIEKLADESPESVRIVATNYFGKAIRSAKTNKDACFWLERLDAFSQSYNPSEGFAPLMLSIGRVMFPQG